MKSKLDSESVDKKIILKIERYSGIKAKQETESEGTDMFWMNPQMKKF
jgi:hypothetical protein